MTDELDDKEIIETDNLEGGEGAETAVETEEGKEGEFEVTFETGKEAENNDPFKGQEAPKWVKEQRKQNRELQKQNRELQEKIKAFENPQTVQIGEKPTLESCDYDADRFEKSLNEYNERKLKVEENAKVKQQEIERQNRSWQETLTTYETKKKELPVKDFDDSEETVRDTLSPIQQSIIIGVADNPAIVIYALGKNPDKAAELAAITDHAKFTYALAKFEGQLKVTKKTPPQPESKVRGSSVARTKGIADAKLEALRAQAEKTGDYTQVVAYKRQVREKQLN